MEHKDFYSAYADLSKHLVTLAIALLSLSITFIDKLKSNLKSKNDYSYLIWIWILLTVSIFLGLLSSYLGIDQSLMCVANDVYCVVGTNMKASIVSCLIVFSSCFVLIAFVGYKALSNSATIRTELKSETPQTDEAKPTNEQPSLNNDKTTDGTTQEK